MKINEIIQPKQFYHGSNIKLPVGTILTPNKNYEEDWGHTDFYKVLEKYRTNNMLSHKNSVFMCDNPDDIDNAGGGTEYLFKVSPIGIVQKHDLNWGSEIDCLLSDGYSVDSLEIKNCAMNYWNGISHTDENVWEYLTPSAKIIKVFKY